MMVLQRKQAQMGYGSYTIIKDPGKQVYRNYKWDDFEVGKHNIQGIG